MIVIDGSYGEGGGQILRTSLALSAITGQAFEIADIRKNRPEPGLKPQHLFAAKIVQQLCSADVEGMEQGSQRLLFVPGKIAVKSQSFDITTAGSISLVLQSVLLPLCFGDKKAKLTLVGGTDVKWSMPIDYLREVLIPQLKRFADIDIKMLSRGYYPKGGGTVEIGVNPKISPQPDSLLASLASFAPLDLNARGELVKVDGISHASSDLQDARVAERQADSARLQLQELNCPVSIQAEYSRTKCTGSGITLWATFFAEGQDDLSVNPIILGADSLGERGKSADMVGKEAASRLLQEIGSGACADRHLADNLIPLIGLAGGSFTASAITEHCKTNIYVVEKFLSAKFKVDGNRISAALG